MKLFVKCLILTVLVITINNCALFSGGAVMQAINEIDASSLSSENEDFQQKAGIKLIVVKRGLWSMQSTFKNSMMNSYYKKLLDNSLVYSLDENQKEYVQQKTLDNVINITVNNQFQSYTEYEKAILLIASTSTLALLNDPNFNKKEIPNMFFKFIESYDAREIPGIVNAQWYKKKDISITDNGGIIIN